MGGLIQQRVSFLLLLSYAHVSFTSSWGFPSTTLTLQRSSLVSCFAATTTTTTTTETSTHHQSPIFGTLQRIQVEDESFVSAMSVPTYAAIPSSSDNSTILSPQPPATNCRGLDAIIQPGPAVMIDHVLSPETCQQIIEDCEGACNGGGFETFDSGRNHHGALQLLVSPDVARAVAQRLAPHIDVAAVQALPNHDESLGLAGINRRWRIYKYQPNGVEQFAPHIDAGFPPSGLSQDGTQLIYDDSSSYEEETVVSRLTLLLYLNDDFYGGETNFYEPRCRGAPSHQQQQPPKLIASVRPKTGSALLFPQGVGDEAVDYAREHWPLHEGSPVLPGSIRPKYVIRSDVLFVTNKHADTEDNHLDDLPAEFTQYDDLVRHALLPSSSNSPTHNPKFLHHVAALYNPHMGVEHLGPFLYSFLRMTKVQRVVEIGAGYTSLWILQALQDNYNELLRIQKLTRQGQCQLLGTDFCDASIVEKHLSVQTPPKLLCIDNCLHQKETATGARAVAQSLGLEHLMEFRRGDAMDMDIFLENEQVDVLWCDFGVGSRMREFVAGAWPSIRPGGFLLCHSTLTNQRTRDWLEACRNREPESVTGITPDAFVEISLLEPHKRFQNSISIFQKRKSGDGVAYQEPIYSEYA